MLCIRVGSGRRKFDASVMKGYFKDLVPCKLKGKKTCKVRWSEVSKERQEEKKKDICKLVKKESDRTAKAGRKVLSN